MKRNSLSPLIIVASLLMSVVQISAYADHCFMKGIAGVCSFESLSSNSSPHVYFHCEADNSLYVKMYTHNVLAGGFMPGSGTLTLTGSEVKKVLSKYFFEVTHDAGHKGIKYIAFTSLGSIHCNIGTGGRTAVFPGAFAVNSVIE